MKKIKGLGHYYVLLCDEWSTLHRKDKASLLICGVYSSKKEAQDVAEEIKDCPCKHLIKKCSVEVTIQTTPPLVI